MQNTLTTEAVVMDAIDVSIRDVFKTMLGQTIEQIEAIELLEPTPSCESDGSAISVVMCWTGGLKGSLTLTLSEQSAIAWTEGLLGPGISGVNQDVVDAIGELANLVVGSAKSRLSDFSITMSLPVVIHAGLGSMGLQSNTLDFRMTYGFPGGKVCILVAITPPV